MQRAFADSAKALSDVLEQNDSAYVPPVYEVSPFTLWIHDSVVRPLERICIMPECRSDYIQGVLMCGFDTIDSTRSG